MSSRVTLVFEQVKQFGAPRDGERGLARQEPRQVIEHAVLFNMPYLQGDQEASLLQSLYNVQFEFDNVLQLSVGKVLNNQDVCTHVLIIRFPTIQVLLEYYQSEARFNVAAKLNPYLHGMHTVDYATMLSPMDNIGAKAGLKWVSLNFLRVKEDICPEKAEENLRFLSAIPKDLEYVKELTVGFNLYVRDRMFSHSYAAYFNSVESLEMLQKDPRYELVLKDKILPICSKIVSVKFLAYKPVLSAL